MVNIESELKSLLSGGVLHEVIEPKLEELAVAALKALEPLIIDAIKAELISMLGAAPGAAVSTAVVE